MSSSSPSSPALGSHGLPAKTLVLAGIMAFVCCLCPKALAQYSGYYSSQGVEYIGVKDYNVTGGYQIVPVGPGTIAIVTTSTGTGGVGMNYMEYDVSTNDPLPFFWHYYFFAPGDISQLFVDDTVTGNYQISINSFQDTNGEILVSGNEFVGTPGATVTITEAAYEWDFMPYGDDELTPGLDAPMVTDSIQYTLPPGIAPPPTPGPKPPGYGPPQAPSVKNSKGDPVDVTTGQFTQNHVDLEVNGPLPIDIKRSYSSLSGVANELGYGWVSGYPCYLDPSSDLSTISASDGNGAVILLRRNGNSNIWTPLLSDNPSISAGSGGATNPLNSYITWNGGSVYEWFLPDGSVRIYTVQTFNYSPLPYLAKIVDNRGNYLQFSYGNDSAAGSYGLIVQIYSSNGSSVNLTYNPSALLTQATASDGRTVNYSYSYVGDLTGVQLPDGSNYTYQYGTFPPGYVSDHLIAEIREPDNRLVACNYDSLNRVTAQFASVGSSSFDYSIPGQTTVKDALGRPTIYKYSGNLITQITDPMGRTITQTWYGVTNSNGAYQNSLQSITDKRGLVTTFAYDSQANITQTTITGDLEGTGGTQSATSTATYNSLNLPTVRTNASGIATYYSYADPNYPYLPTQITTAQGGVEIRADVLTYGTYQDPVNPTTHFSAGLLAQKVAGSGPGQAVTNYAYNTAGFLTQKTDFTGTSDPSVVTSYSYTSRGELASATDGDGRTTSYTYDGLGRPLTKVVRDETGNVVAAWTTTYDGSGDIIQVVGPRSGPTSSEQWTLDGGGRVIQDTVSRIQATANGTGIALAPSATTSYTVDDDGEVTASSDPLGVGTTYGLDGDGELVSKVTAGIRTELYGYEPGGNVSTYVNPLGGTTTKSYTSTGKLCVQQNPDGSVLQWQYYADGRLQKEVLRNGSYWLVTYDDVAQTVTRTLTQPNGTQLASETDVYDPRGNLISHTDVDGNTTTTTYDGLNRVKAVTGPASVAGSAQRTSVTSYGASEKTAIIQDGLGGTTTTTYDALGRPLQTQVQDALGNSIRLTTNAYSTDNYSVKVTQGSGAGAISSTMYSDLAGNVLQTVYGDGTFSNNTYDPVGDLLSTTDPLGQTTRYSYNTLNQRVSQTLPDGTVTNFTYDTAGDLLTRAMAGGALNLQQTFDSAGRKLTEALVSAGVSTRQFGYSYYPSGSPWAGLLQTTTTPRSTATFAYDNFLRPQTVTTVGSLPAANISTSYAYDNRGLPTSISQSSVNDAAGPPTQVSRAYDGDGNLLSDAVSLGGQLVSNVSQTWDAAGRRASLNEANSSLPSPLFSYQHRADGLVTQVAANNQNYSFGYADNGLITSRASPLRSVSIDSRDSVGRILQQTTSVGSNPLMVEDMTWRGDGTLNTYAVARNGTGAWNESRAYAYNSRSQLVSEGFSPAAGSSSSLAYTFDGSNPGLGVRTDAKVGAGAPSQWEESATAIDGFAQVTQDQVPSSSSVVQANGVALGADHVNVLVDGVSQGLAAFPGWTDPIGNWSINLSLAAGVHTLTANAVHPSGLYTATASSTFTVSGTPGGDVTNTFDADGNVTSRTWPNGLSQVLTWDSFYRLVRVSQRDATGNGYDWSAIYDGLGRRIQTTQQLVASGVVAGSPTVTSSIYDPQVEFLEIGVALNGAKAWKVYGPDLNGRFGSLQGVGGLEATIVDATGSTQGVVNDQFGNGVATVTGGVATWSATRVGAYGPLPGVQAATLTDITQLASVTAWHGWRIDPTGFYSLGARNYDPTSGRFLSADPLGQGESPSLYDLCGGDPINRLDPDGRSQSDSGKTDSSQMPPSRNTQSSTPQQGGGNPSDPNSQIVKDTASASDAAYDKGGTAPPGYMVDGVYTVEHGGTNAVLFENENDGSLILAFEGTDIKSLNDIYTDAVNAHGKYSSRYANAIKIAAMIKAAHPSTKITITGHSLGGGEGGLAALATGLTAITFNAAGVDPQIYNVPLGDQSNITNYSVLGEPLTTLQFLSCLLSPFHLLPKVASAVGKTQIVLFPHTVPSLLDNTDNHAMSSVRQAIGAPAPISDLDLIPGDDDDDGDD
jgi:RHS repeat-associated protein